MELLSQFSPLLVAIIAFVAVLTGLGFVFNLKLDPVKKDIEILKIGQAKLETRMDSLDKELKEIKWDVSEIKGKLDQLLAKS